MPRKADPRQPKGVTIVPVTVNGETIGRIQKLRGGWTALALGWCKVRLTEQQAREDAVGLWRAKQERKSAASPRRKAHPIKDDKSTNKKEPSCWY